MSSYSIANAFQANAILELTNLTEAANITADVLRAPIPIVNWATADLSNVQIGRQATFPQARRTILKLFLFLSVIMALFQG
jgi:hypothetical protein